MAKRHRVEPKSFRKRSLPWLWAGMTPSLIIDGVLIYRLIAGLVSDPRGQTVSLIANFGMLLIMNEVLFKTLPLIIYFVHRSNIKQSFVTVKNDEVIYQKRLLVMYEFDYGYTFFHEYHLQNIDSCKQRRNGSLVVKGQFKVRCLQEDGEVVNDLRKKDLLPRILNRTRCMIPGVFEDMDKITAQLNELAADSATASIG